MAQMTRNDQGQERPDLAAAALDRGREQLENAKEQLAEGAERVAAAVERTTEELDGEDGQGAISGFGRSVASLTRQLAGGLRERDVEEFARELATLARRNPGVFLAGSVALGFGIARFFKARTPSAATAGAGWNDAAASSGRWDSRAGGVASDAWHDGDQQFVGTQPEFDAEDGLDLSGGAQWHDQARATDLPQSAEADASSRSDGKSNRNTQGAASSGSYGAGGSQDPESPLATTGPEETSGGKA